MSFYGATDTPVLDFGSCLFWVSKPEWEVFFTLGRGIHDVCSLRFTSGVTPADLLIASMTTSHCSPHACFSRSRMPDSNGDLPHSSLCAVLSIFFVCHVDDSILQFCRSRLYIFNQAYGRKGNQNNNG